MAGLLAAPPISARRAPDRRLRNATDHPDGYGDRLSRGVLRSAEGRSPDEKREAEAPRLAVLVLQPCGLDVVAGGLSGAPPSEKGPIGLGCGATFLRAIRDSRF